MGQHGGARLTGALGRGSTPACGDTGIKETLCSSLFCPHHCHVLAQLASWPNPQLLMRDIANPGWRRRRRSNANCQALAPGFDQSGTMSALQVARAGRTGLASLARALVSGGGGGRAAAASPGGPI